MPRKRQVLNPDDLPAFRLASILKQCREEDGNVHQMAQRINEAMGYEWNGEDPPQFLVDRRKLVALMNCEYKFDENLKLSLRELVALDRYLKRFNTGLPSLFRSAQLLQVLADTGRINVVFASRAQKPERGAASRPSASWYDLSQWDVLSLARLQTETNRLTTNARFDIQTVLLQESESEARAAAASSGLLADPTRSLVAIGSPRASHITEGMFAGMFGVPPFSRARPANEGPPFRFVWKREKGVFPGCTTWFEDDLKAEDAKLARRVRDFKAWAVWTRKRIYVSELASRGPSKAYGVLAVQRRPGGQIWLGMAGLTGVGTLATAEILPMIQNSLPHVEEGTCSPVLWAVVEAEVEIDSSENVAGPRILSQTLVEGPKLWEPGS